MANRFRKSKRVASYKRKASKSYVKKPPTAEQLRQSYEFYRPDRPVRPLDSSDS